MKQVTAVTLSLFALVFGVLSWRVQAGQDPALGHATGALVQPHGSRPLTSRTSGAAAAPGATHHHATPLTSRTSGAAGAPAGEDE